MRAKTIVVICIVLGEGVRRSRLVYTPHHIDNIKAIYCYYPKNIEIQLEKSTK